MTIKELNKAKVPIIRIDPKLDRFEKMNLFQYKVDEANRILARVGLPGDKPKKTKGFTRRVSQRYSKPESEMLAVHEPLPKYKKRRAASKTRGKGKSLPKRKN